MIIASIDIGTNTVLMIVADAVKGAKSFKVLENEHRIPRLGKDLLPGKPIAEENLNRFYNVLIEYKNIIDSYKCEFILTAATSAFRQASNSREIIEYVKKHLGIDINIITGKKEARLSYMGAVSGFNSDTDNMVIDIGGGSTELIIGRKTDIYFNESFPVGVVNSSEKFQKNGILNIQLLNDQLARTIKIDNGAVRAPDKVIAVAGTPTTLACIKKGIREFNEEIIEGAVLTREDLDGMIDSFSKMTPEEILIRYSSVVKGREDLILSGTCILLFIMNLFHINQVIVSTKGIRFGLIYEWINS